MVATPTIPSQTTPVYATSHTADSQAAYQSLGFLAQALAQGMGGSSNYPSGNSSNLSAIATFLASGQLFVGEPLTGPSSTQPTVWKTLDNKLVVMPLSTYGLSGDDSVWINYALSHLTGPGVTGPMAAACVNGGIYNIENTVGGSNWVYGTFLDLNQSTFNWASSTASAICVDMEGSSANPNEEYLAGGMYNGYLWNTGSATNPIALKYGAGYGFRFDNLKITNFYDSTNSGGIGIWECSGNGPTEKTRLQASVFRAGNSFLIDSVNPGSGPSWTAKWPSHEYNVWDLHVTCYPEQTAIKVINDAYTSGSRLHLYGNMHETGSDPSGAGAAIDLSNASGVIGSVNMNFTLIYVEMETTDTGTYNWTTVKFGGSGTMNNSMGMMRFVDGGWNLSDATSAEFSFGGMVYEAGGSATTGLRGANSAPDGWL